ncbi:MAG: metal-dependent transcriptional regulator [Clostridia bacterium]|nr:metal-dependent transcriptional regulator [Clostridia bacterium]
MSIHESGENYLEQIYMLSRQKEKVRAVDLCTALGFSRPTVSVMLRELRSDGFVTTAENGGLILTQKGEDVAKRMYERHCIIAEVLMRLGVSHDVALNDACKIEHDISDETFFKIRDYLDGTK